MIGDRALFLAPEDNLPQLWSTDGTAANTVDLGVAFRPVLHARAGQRAVIGGYDSERTTILASTTDAATLPAVFASVRRSAGFFDQIELLARNSTRAYLRLSRLRIPDLSPQIIEVWSSDGTAAGTELLFPLYGDAFSHEAFMASDSHLYTAFIDEAVGLELWAAVLNEEHTCPIDCDRDAQTTDAELEVGLAMALGQPGATCASVGGLRDVTVDQLVAAIACRDAQP